MGDEDDEVMLRKGFEDIHDKNAVLFIKVPSWFIAHDETRFFDDGTGDADALSLPTRKPSSLPFFKRKDA